MRLSESWSRSRADSDGSVSLSASDLREDGACPDARGKSIRTMVSNGSVAVPSLRSSRASAPDTSTPICDRRGSSLRLIVTVLDAKSMRVSSSVSTLDADTDDVDDDDVLGSVDG